MGDPVRHATTWDARVMFGLALITFVPCGCCKDRPKPTEGTEMSAIRHDFSSPEGAILCLEDAYRSKDLAAAVACKDFKIEARLMLDKFEKLPKEQIDDALVAQTAEVLELAYRKELKEEGFPDMTGVISTFPKKETFKEDVVIVTEVCHYPDSGTSQQKILVAKTANGWRVLNPTH